LRDEVNDALTGTTVTEMIGFDTVAKAARVCDRQQAVGFETLAPHPSHETRTPAANTLRRSVTSR